MAFDGILRGWFDRGVPGFRIDVANAIVKDRLLGDDPATVAGATTLDEPQIIYSMHRPEVHDVLRRWRAIADEYQPPRVLIGETWVRDLPELASYYGEGTELHLAFNFAFATAPFEARALRTVIDATQRALGTDPWPLWTASNHDIGGSPPTGRRGRNAGHDAPCSCCSCFAGRPRCTPETRRTRGCRGAILAVA